MKPWYTSKTLWVNIIALAGSILVGLGVFTEPQWTAGLAGTVLTVTNIILRLTTGVGIEGVDDAGSADNTSGG